MTADPFSGTAYSGFPTAQQGNVIPTSWQAPDFLDLAGLSATWPVLFLGPSNIPNGLLQSMSPQLGGPGTEPIRDEQGFPIGSVLMPADANDDRLIERVSLNAIVKQKNPTLGYSELWRKIPATSLAVELQMFTAYPGEQPELALFNPITAARFTVSAGRSRYAASDVPARPYLVPKGALVGAVLSVPAWKVANSGVPANIALAMDADVRARIRIEYRTAQ